MNRGITIPRIPQAFLKWYCKPEKYEEIQGDLEEFFYERVEVSGLAKARLFYTWNVLRCFQPYAWKVPQSQNSTIVMFKNYFKTSYRSMMRNPIYSFINLFGLSTAIGVCIVGYAFVEYTFKIDQFHENGNEVYLTTFFADIDGAEQQNGTTPIPLGAALREDFAQIVDVCRIENRRVVVKYDGHKVFHESVSYVDPEYLEMFNFPMKWGSAGSLKEQNSIILSENMAKKYFGSDYPIGSELKVIFAEDRSKVFKVTAVADEFPGARSFDFDFLIHFENLRSSIPDYDLTDWSTSVDATFVYVEDPDNLQLISERMEKYSSAYNEKQGDWSISSFAFEPVSSLYQNSGKIRNDISGGGDGFRTLYYSSVSFIIIGFFVLVLAASNYINIAIVSAARRLKEIGLRKVIGAHKRMVVVQFMAENLMMMSIALVVGFILGSTVFTPWLENTMHFDMDFTLNDTTLLIVLPSILLFTGIISGIYPAFYISRFQVASIFRKSFRIGKKNYLTRVFLGFQLLLACILISIAVVFRQNSDFQLQRSWGYDKDQALYMQVTDRSAFEQLQAEISRYPSVTSISGSSHHLGRKSINTLIDLPDRQYEVSEMAVDSKYF